VKKGILAPVLAMLIIGLMVAGILFFVAYKSEQVIKKKGDIEICRSSMKKLQFVTELSKGLVWSTLDCPYSPETASFV